MATRSREIKKSVFARARKASLRGKGGAKIALVGPSGSGKTSLAANTPRPLVLQLEKQGEISVANSNPDAFVLPIDDYAHLDDVWKMIKGAPLVMDDGRPCLKLPDVGLIETIVLDSVSALAEMAKLNIVSANNPTETNGVVTFLDMAKGKGKMQLQHYGLLNNSFELFLYGARDLPVNIIFIFHLEQYTDPETGLIVQEPITTTKKFSHLVGKFFNAVGQVFCKEEFDRKTGEVSSKTMVSFVNMSKKTTWCKRMPGYPAQVIVEHYGDSSQWTDLFIPTQTTQEK